MVTTAPVLAFYDVNKPTEVSADPSSYGLSGVLLQKHGGQPRPVAFASHLNGEYVTLEEFIKGTFKKYINNTGEICGDECSATSHLSQMVLLLRRMLLTLYKLASGT